MSVFVRTFRGHTLCLYVDECCDHGENLKGKVSELEGIPVSYLTLFHHGHKVTNEDVVLPGECYQALLCLKGGKGGFGSMLRMIGAQIDKTTNHDACRDLSGRRMRDVNNEKKLSEWINKKAELEEERRQKRKEKLERLKHEPRHIFVDPSYDKQKREVIDNLDDAITQGIQASASVNNGASSSGVASVKRKAESSDSCSKKRAAAQWMGIDEENDSDGSEENDSEKNEDEETMTKSALAQAANTESPSGTDTSSPGGTDTSSPGGTDTSSTVLQSSTPTVPDSNPEGTTKQDTTAEHQVERTAADGTTEGHKSLLDILPAPTSSVEDGSSKAQENQQAPAEPLILDQISSVDELKTYGLDALKSALMALGMKCGGSVHERAERLYSVKGIEPGEIDSSLMAKLSKGKKGKKAKGK